MAWAIDTYTGLKAFGASGPLRVGMFEICRAINERQDCLALTKSTFYKADGSLAADIDVTDLLGMRTAGVNNYFGLNCDRIMTAIKVLIPYFTAASGISSVWTLATLEAAVGLGEFLDRPEKIQQALFFQQCQGALDLLIHARRTGNVAFHASWTTFDLYESGDDIGDIGSDVDRQVVWADAAGDTPTTAAYDGTSGVGFEISHGGSGGFGGAFNYYYGAKIQNNFDSALVSTIGMEGAVQGIEYTVRWATPYVPFTGGGSITGSIGSTSFSRTLAANLDFSETIVGDESDISLDTSNYLLVTAEVPETCPLDARGTPDTNPDGSGIGFKPLTWALYFDIAGELTDQA